MLQAVDSILRRRCTIIVVTGFLLSFILPLFYFRAGLIRATPFERFQWWLEDRVQREAGALEAPHVPALYDWDTRSAFRLVNQSQARDAAIEDLCQSFPTHLLENIQPVLKTGHAVLQDRVPTHLQSVSACLDNLIIVSDLDEEVEGRKVTDVIRDIPAGLRNGASSQLESYNIQKTFAADNALDKLNATELKTRKIDRFKFLTQISYVWKTNPDRRWYVFYEDDTYIFWDNIFRLLSHFDPDQPYYFGSPSPGCTSIEEEEIWFANGGPGYILSRGAMRVLVKDDWDVQGHYLGPKLQQKYWDRTLSKCCGDSVLGCVLWMKGITLSGLWPMFNVHRPHRIPFSGRIWCQPALTSHKPSKEEMRELWRWEWEHRQTHRPLIWRDIATSYWNFAGLTTLDDWDNTGRGTHKAPLRSKHYSHNPHESFDACRRACEALPGCLQYMFHLRTCKIGRDMLLMGEHREPQLGKVGKDLSEEESKMDWNPDDLRFRSGWVQDKVKKWIDQRPCEKVRWVRPSLERIF